MKHRETGSTRRVGEDDLRVEDLSTPQSRADLQRIVGRAGENAYSAICERSKARVRRMHAEAEYQRALENLARWKERERQKEIERTKRETAESKGGPDEDRH
jgi:hypothetical protein